MSDFDPDTRPKDRWWPAPLEWGKTDIDELVLIVQDILEEQHDEICRLRDSQPNREGEEHGNQETTPR